MKKSSIILAVMFGLLGLLAVQSNIQGQGADREVFSDIEPLAGEVFTNECTDPPTDLTVIEGEYIEKFVETELPTGTEKEFFSVTAHGTAEDSNGCMYSISLREHGVATSNGAQGSDTEVEGEALMFKPKDPKCGTTLHSLLREVETPSGMENEWEKIMCHNPASSSSMGAVRETETFSADITGEEETHPCTGETVQFLSGTYRESEAVVTLPTGVEKELEHIVVHGIAADGSGTVYTVRGNSHENFSSDGTTDSGNFHENVVFQPHGSDGVAFHCLAHVVETPSGKELEWEKCECPEPPALP